MFHVEEDPTVRRYIDTLYGIGAWPKDSESKLWILCKRIGFYLHYFSFLVYVLIGERQAYKSRDRKQIIFLGEIQIAVSLALMKLAYLLWYKDEILTFFYNVNVTHYNANRDESAIVKCKNGKIALFNKVYAIGVTIAAMSTLVTALPIFTNDDKMLPLFIHFNVECNYDRILFWIAFVHASVVVICSGIYTGIMVIVWYIMYNYSIEYKLLGQRLGLLGVAEPNTYHRDLIYLIEGRNKLFETVENFRSFFSKLFLIEILVGAASICVSTYNLAYNTPDNPFEVTLYATILCYAFSEIFLLMYFANEITLESDRLSYCLFESNWTDQSKSTNKCVIVFGETIRRPHHMAVLIYPMNLEKFVSIVSSAYSLFNILQTFK